MMRAIKNRPYPQLSMMKILSQSYILPLNLSEGEFMRPTRNERQKKGDPPKESRQMYYVVSIIQQQP